MCESAFKETLTVLKLRYPAFRYTLRFAFYLIYLSFVPRTSIRTVKVKVKQSHYRPGQSLRVSGV
jgi:hypothetical protein